MILTDSATAINFSLAQAEVDFLAENAGQLLNAEVRVSHIHAVNCDPGNLARSWMLRLTITVCLVMFALEGDICFTFIISLLSSILIDHTYLILFLLTTLWSFKQGMLLILSQVSSLTGNGGEASGTCPLRGQNDAGQLERLWWQAGINMCLLYVSQKV